MDAAKQHAERASKELAELSAQVAQAEVNAIKAKIGLQAKEKPLASAKAAFETAHANTLTKQAAYDSAVSAEQQAKDELDAAQANYDAALECYNKCSQAAGSGTATGSGSASDASSVGTPTESKGNVAVTSQSAASGSAVASHAAVATLPQTGDATFEGIVVVAGAGAAAIAAGEIARRRPAAK